MKTSDTAKAACARALTRLRELTSTMAPGPAYGAELVCIFEELNEAVQQAVAEAAQRHR
jgi:16S rRNA G527 N7-methylase RsmG